MAKKSNVPVHMLLIRIPKSYQVGMGSLFLYELTRGYWRVDIQKIGNVKAWPYAAVVFKDTILEVYKIDAWQTGAEAVMLTRVPNAAEKDRYVFTGTIAPKSIRQRFVGQSCLNFKPGDQSPVRYL